MICTNIIVTELENRSHLVLLELWTEIELNVLSNQWRLNIVRTLSTLVLSDSFAQIPNILICFLVFGFETEVTFKQEWVLL